MKRNTHRWQRKSCLLLMLLAFGGAAPLQAAVETNISATRPVAWTISGRVVSASGDALPGVTILLKGTSTGTATDVSGNYTLSVPEAGGTLIFSFIGYTTQERTFTGPGTINVTLADDAKALEEVVVTGYGTQQKSDITGSVASVKGEEVAQIPTPSIAQALQGRAPGVQITANSGSPGAGSSVRIRGVASVNAVDVLYVVDGVQIPSSAGVNFLNNDDIASVEVLKDASAAAIYGSRAAGGVILITTKKGKANTSNVNFSAYKGIQNTWRKLDMTNLREYAALDNLARQNAGVVTNPEWANPESLGEGTNWQDALFRTADIENYQLSWGGGSENSTFYASGSYYKREGIVLGSAFDRYTFRLNTDHKIGKRFKVGNSLQVSATSEDIIPNNQDLQSGVLGRGIRQVPSVNVRNPDGTYDGPLGNFEGESENPVFLALESNNNSRNYRAIGSIYGDIELFSGLSFRSTFNIDAYMYDNTDFNPAFQIGNRTSNVASLNVSEGNGRTWQWSNIFTYRKTFGNHSINALAGIEAQDNHVRFYSASRAGFLKNDEIQYLDQGSSSDQARGGANGYALYSQLARVNYDYANKYLLTATVRRDGSSRFGKENRYGVFPSASLGYRISEEDFVKSLPVITNLMLRAGWGETGNQAGLSNYPVYASLSANGRYPFGGTVLSGYYVPTQANPDIRWETVQQTNFGIDAGFFQNKLSLSVDYFIKNTTDMILTIEIPRSTGPNAGPTNSGALVNRGVELAANYQGEAGDFRYGLGLNFTRVRNEVTELQDIPLSGEYNRTQEGMPVAQFWGYRMEGLFRSDEEVRAANALDGNPATAYQPGAAAGDVRFADINGDGVVDSEDQTFIGNPLPKFTAGLTGNVAYKQFDMNFIFSGSFGNDILNRISAFGYSADPGNKFRALINNTWTPQNPNAEYPRLILGDPGGSNRANSSRWIEDGTYVRLRNIQVGYNFAPTLLSRIGGKTARVYLASENLFTLTKYKSGFDPEQGASYGDRPLDIGTDRGNYPQARTFLLGINVGF
ncbi:MAG: SusC/RagA family TonB-linked outer membrane protein [Adhaeribacter sp.]